MGLKPGKLPEVIWKRSVYRFFENKKKAGQGKDKNALKLARFPVKAGKELLTVPASGSLPIPDLPFYVMLEAANSLAAAGAVPTGAEIMIFAPEGMEEQRLRDFIQNVAESADILKMEILSICVETAAAVCQPVLSVTGIGALESNCRKMPADVQEGWDILAVGYAGGEGTAILSGRWESKLLARYHKDFIEKAKVMKNALTAVAAAKLLHQRGDVLVFPAGEGGIFGALWELGSYCGKGFAVDGRKIPMRQQTVEVCEFFDVNPYMLKSTGCLAAVLENGGSARDELRKNGIPAEMIGHITKGNDRILVSGEEARYLEPYRTDEIYKIFQKEKNPNRTICETEG